MNSIFITGTGTDIGKTYISALIMKKLINLNINACYFKPALSGAKVIKGSIYAEDIEYVKKISSLKEDSNNLSSFIYNYPASPHLSASIENNPFNIEKVIYDYNKLKEKYDFILLEGAGGVYCPFNINPLILTKDIIKAFNCPIILVSEASLGAINNTMLALHYIRQENINIKGVIFNNFTNSLIENDNINFITKYGETSLLAVVKKNDTEIDINIDKLLW